MALKYNPFQPNSIVAPGMFVGRTDELNTIETNLFQAKNGNPQHFLIEGERGIGKSSLFLLVEAVAAGNANPLHTDPMRFLTVSVELGGVQNQVDIVRNIGRELKVALGKRDQVRDKVGKVLEFLMKWEVLGVRYHSVANVPDADEARDALVDSFVETTSLLCGTIDGIFVIIDEADAPPETAGLGEFIKFFTEKLTKRGCNNVLIGMAGLPSTIPKMKASHESSARILEILRLLPLDHEEIKRVVRKGLEVAKATNKVETAITSPALSLLCELSEGYPHFIQQFAYCAFAEDTDNHIDIHDVLDGAYKDNGAIHQLGSKYFNEMFYGRINSPDYRKVLVTMARYGDGWVSKRTIVSESGVKESIVGNAINALKSRQVILVDEGRQGHYKLPTKSFAAWINAVQTVRKRTGSEGESDLGENPPSEDGSISPD